MDYSLTDEQKGIQAAVARLCQDYPDEYWRSLDQKHEYPTAFVDALIQGGWLSVLIPEEYGGSGFGLTEASLILETINRSGGTGMPAHAQMYVMGTILRHGSEEQKCRLLPPIAKGEVRLQSFAITEPDAGSDTTQIKTFARRDGLRYVISGAKVFTSRFGHSDAMLLLARTTPYDEVVRKTDGLSVFYIDLRQAREQISATPIRTMVNHDTYALFFENLEVPVDNLIGEEGRGFRAILSGMNAERILVASEILGDGFWFIDKASKYACERIVFGRPIGANQGVQFPIAQAYANLEAASLMRWKAAQLFDQGDEPGFEANAAKLLATQATWASANAAMDTFGGYGFVSEYDVERKFREVRLPMVAPVNNNLILAYIGEHVLGMPRSY
ncbi:MAG: acyl-CoA dehydrogenase [Sulfobacillus acidophilus]|uniref:Acyl-CoA dehydrogenase n=1 Tax=Sulfobacillus acidophilus TaxID=53633 RepID=A0A2T2WNC0_9FIRM|nr:MAG: acyl-CoA dehydrogenase [Sulfobacillus acidophilus]